jgi:hypothetical protein
MMLLWRIEKSHEWFLVVVSLLGAAFLLPLSCDSFVLVLDGSWIDIKGLNNFQFDFSCGLLTV